MKRGASLLLLTAAAASLWAQRSGMRYTGDRGFTVARSNDWQPGRRDGRCIIRVTIDDEADVELRGDRVRIWVIKGAPGEDQRNPGSECNAPLPNRGIRNFRFRGVDGRGNVRLVQEPRDSNGNVAVVNIQDPKGGSEGYTYELTWESNGFGGGGNSGGGGFFPGGSGGSGSGGGFFPGGGGLPEMNVSTTGFGSLFHNGTNYRLNELFVRVQRNTCEVALMSDQGQRVEMNGFTADNRPECQLNRSNNGRLNGQARFTLNGNRITQVELNGTMNGSSFRGTFRPR